MLFYFIIFNKFWVVEVTICFIKNLYILLINVILNIILFINTYLVKLDEKTIYNLLEYFD